MTFVIAKSTHQRLPPPQTAGDSADAEDVAMTRQVKINRRAPDWARFVTIVVELLTVHVALAAIQRPLELGASSLRWSVAAQGVLLGSFVVVAVSGTSTAAVAAAPVATASARTSRAALGVFGVVSAASEVLGALERRLLPADLAWHWALVAHAPVAVVLVGTALRLLPSAVVHRDQLELEATSAIVVTSAIMLIVQGLRSGGLLA
jgi:hypothetical protein